MKKENKGSGRKMSVDWGGIIVFGMVAFAFVAAILLIIFGDRDSSYSSYYNYDRDYYRPPKKQVTLEKRRDYDDSTQTLKETTTMTKIFPNVKPEDLEEV
jgi:hypothetical protein